MFINNKENIINTFNMKKIIFILIFILTSCSIESQELNFSYINSPEIIENKEVSLPSDFFINQNINFLEMPNFSIVDDKWNNLGYELRESFNLTNKTINLNKDNLTLYNAKILNFTVWTEIEVSDSNWNKIWLIKEKLFTSLFNNYSTYEIYDLNDNLIGESKKEEFWNTEFNIYDKNNEIVASIRRPAFNMLDSWGISIKNDKINKVLFLFIPAFKSLSDQES